eukprot:scaffold240580_cov14-Tisochrysis_lutea.AAC.1
MATTVEPMLQGDGRLSRTGPTPLSPLPSRLPICCPRSLFPTHSLPPPTTPSRATSSLLPALSLA